MPAAFAPLVVPATQRAADGTTFHLKVIPQAKATPVFKPLQPAATAAATAAHAPHPARPPKVTLLRDGNRVTHLRLECACGEIFELACEY